MYKRIFSLGLFFLSLFYFPAATFSMCLSEQGQPTGTNSYEVANEGAWCWFADPRALHYESKDGSINKTYIGYIDIHGNIKAMQYDFKKKKQEEVLIRSYFQPDDHNNPTFLVLPDERIMIFYSRHTDERCFYYRISEKAGDIATLGKEYRLDTQQATTYPSPFILSNDPEHIYLCWRGIEWHPTIGRLTLPDAEGHCQFDWEPKQIVRYSIDGVKARGGSRPYAKYSSNGKDKIYMTYTTTHPDNEVPNWVYFNHINIPTTQKTSEITLTDIKGKVLSKIDEQVHIIQKSPEYLSAHTDAVVDHPDSYRNWVWQVATDKDGYPVIAMVRISGDKTSHNYYYARWTGKEWRNTFLTHAGGHFHQTPTTEKCYSGGMSIDPENANIIYCSVPVEGQYGNVYEIIKYTLDDNDYIVSQEAITKNSSLNNVRPYIVPASANSSLRLTWMYGNYYDWIVSVQRPKGYSTSIYSDFRGFSSESEPNKEISLSEIRNFKFDRKKDFDVFVTITPDTSNYQGCLLELGKLKYHLDKENMKPEVRYNGKIYKSTNILGTSDTWREMPRSTNGKWYPVQKYTNFRLRMKYENGVLRIYINGLLDQTITI